MSALNCFDCHELEQELKIARLMADTAYQRGREDAAKAVGALYNILSWDDIVRTARGEIE